MEIGEVKIYEIEDGKIWSKKIADDFYLVNGVYCAVFGHRDMEDVSTLMDFMAAAKSDVFPYSGADEGFVIVFGELLGAPGEYCTFEATIDEFEGVSVIDCKEALYEYRSWAGVCV